MKRLIYAQAVTTADFEPLLFEGAIDEEDLDALTAIDWQIAPEDAEMLVRGILVEGIKPADIKKVTYYKDDMLIERLGYDGGYTLTQQNGATDSYGFYAGDSDLYPIVNVYTS